MTINRCVCFDVHFETLKSTACATDADSVSALQEEIAFGHNCEACHPYVRRMLQTGQTTFSEIISEERGSSSSR